MASTLELEIKIEELCRTCLSKDNELVSIFDVFVGSTVTLDYIVTSTTGLKISKNDGLPSTICCECKEKASKAFDFKKKSEEANMSLRGILLKKEKKESTTSISFLSQTNSSAVKTEDFSSHDNDDYADSDFNDPDLNEQEDVKIEHESSERKSCYVCKSCLVVFDTHCKLQEHEKICIKVECDETNRTYCPLCGTCYNGAENLTKHMWENHADLMGPKKRGRPKKMLTSTILNKLSENGFCITSMPAKKIECAFCKQLFETKEELGSHAKTHKDTKVLRCVLCKKIYLDKKNFDQHICIEEKDDVNNVENDSANTETRQAKRPPNFPSEITLREVLDRNLDMDNINLLIVCSTCNCILQSEGELINHRDAEHPELSHRCNLCTKVFASLRSAARHRSICKQIERKYKCNTCGLKFAYEISLNKHILRYHEGQSVSVKFIDSKTKREERQYQCDTCNRSFCKRDLLVKHTKIHMPIENFYQCDVCEKKFHRSDNLRSHKRIHQPQREKTSSSNCLCLYCGRSFSNSSNLIVHMRRHTGEKPYKCDFCGKGFPRSSDLQCHRRSHTGEKPCICRVCGKGFSRSNKLSRHMRVHTGQRPYKCTYCEKAFSQSNDLNLHIRRHTGDRPYICEVCGDRFIQGTALQNHRRAHGHFPAPPTTEAPTEVHALTFTVQSISQNNSH